MKNMSKEELQSAGIYDEEGNRINLSNYKTKKLLEQHQLKMRKINSKKINEDDMFDHIKKPDDVDDKKSKKRNAPNRSERDISPQDKKSAI